MKGRKIQFQIFGLSVGIFRNSETVFGQFGLNFETVFGQFGVEILGFYSDSPNINFRNIFGCF